MTTAEIISTIVCITFFIGISIFIYKINDGEHTPSDDELENNPYGVERPSGRMIDRFGYGK